MIPENILEEFKGRMRIYHHTEDSALEWLLSSSYAVIESTCGSFEITSNAEGKELVFERTRYAYHDSVEYFDENFLSRLHSFGMSLVVLEDETI